MDKLICQKCGQEISNDFNHTLSFCTSCGAGIQNLHTNKTLLYEKAEKTEETPPKLTSPTKSKFGRNFLVTIVLLAGLMLLGGIGIGGYFYWSDKNSSHPDYFGKIVMPTSQNIRVIAVEPDSLDPHLSGYPTIVHALFDGLAEYNNQNTGLSPSLAESWERNADATVWTFRLRKSAKWSDGKPITAQDFVYSWRRILDPKNKSSFLVGLLFFIKNGKAFNERKAVAQEVGVRAIDDYTLEVTMEQPTPFFDKLIAQTAFRPVPRAAIEKFGEAWTEPANIVTSGAFKLKSWTPKEEIVVERNPNFWDNQNTKLERITFIPSEKQAFISNEPIDVENYYQKDADVLLYPKSSSDVFEGKKDFFRFKRMATDFLYLNLTIKPFDDVRVRQALNLAINRQRFKQERLALFPLTSLTPEIKDYQNPSPEGFNPTEARKLLTEAGYPNGNLFPELEFIYLTDDDDKETLEFIKAEWQRELGIKVNLKPQEFKDFFTSRKDKKYRGAAYGSWSGDYDDPYSFLSQFAEENYSGWSDSPYRELLTRANAETNQAKRYEMLGETEKYLLEHQPVIPLFNRIVRFLCKPYVKNFSINRLTQINWREVYVDQNLTVDKLQ